MCGSSLLKYICKLLLNVDVCRCSWIFFRFAWIFEQFFAAQPFGTPWMKECPPKQAPVDFSMSVSKQATEPDPADH